jgi:hypothetical protein
MAIVEDVFLAYLARLQFLHGYALNTYSDAILASGTITFIVGAPLSIRAATQQLLASAPEAAAQRRYLSKELIRYLELFQLSDEDQPLHYLPELRKRQAQQMGLVLPSTRMAPLATGVQLPMIIGAPGGIKPDEYQTVYAPPATVIAAPALFREGGAAHNRPAQPQPLPARR